MKTVFKILFLALFGVLLLLREAHAYLDPGTGSMFLQLLIGSIAAGLLMINVYWEKVKSFFSSRFSKLRRSGDNSPGDKSID